MISEALKCNNCSLTELSLSRDGIKITEGTMAEIKIKMIEWIGNGIEDSGAGMIGEALKCNSALTQLNLASDEIEPIETKWIEMKTNEWIGNRIGESGARMISEALKCNSSLTQLNLSGDDVHGVDNVIEKRG